MKRVVINIVFIVFATISGRCTTDVAVDGGGSEITNGKLVAADGAPMPGREIRAYPDSYIEGKSGDTLIRRTVSGADGSFAFEFDSGAYVIFITDTATWSGVYLRPVTAGMKLGTVRLDTLGSLTGTVRFADTLLSHPPLYVFCKGTPLRLPVAGKESTFRFDGIPTGTYTFLLAKQPMAGCLPGEECNPGSTKPPGTFSSAQVEPGGATEIDTVVSLDEIGLF